MMDMDITTDIGMVEEAAGADEEIIMMIVHNYYAVFAAAYQNV